MIKLFRNIRKNLLNEGKTTKYFKYAIGEIVLVVIGILIALSINNWNENRLISINETKLLTELYNDAKVDSIFFKTRNEFLNEHLTAVKNLNNLYLGIKTDSISNLPFKANGNSVFDPSLAYQSAVKSNFITRIELISNDTIKSTLRKYSLAHHYLELHFEIKDRVFEKNCNDLAIKYFKFHEQHNFSRTIGEYYKGIEFPENENIINYVNGAVIQSKNRAENLVDINTKLLRELRTVLDLAND
jgi:hypothetical protein